jgi:hypothetical protein
MHKIDMKALYTVTKGDPETQIYISKSWLVTVIAILEKNTAYDTSSLRALSVLNGEPKAIVRRKWLSHIYTVLNDLNHHRPQRSTTTTTTTTTTSTKMTPSQKNNFDKAFDHLDVAFRYFDRAFSGKGKG